MLRWGITYKLMERRGEYITYFKNESFTFIKYGPDWCTLNLTSFPAQVSHIYRTKSIEFSLSVSRFQDFNSYLSVTFPIIHSIISFPDLVS